MGKLGKRLPTFGKFIKESKTNEAGGSDILIQGDVLKDNDEDKKKILDIIKKLGIKTKGDLKFMGNSLGLMPEYHMQIADANLGSTKKHFKEPVVVVSPEFRESGKKNISISVEVEPVKSHGTLIDGQSLK